MPLIPLLLANCASQQPGPIRPISIDEDVIWAKSLVAEDLIAFGTASPLQQAVLRNEIITTRMYIADIEYNFYEARLTREMQEEGIVATATNLGLTTSATLVGAAQTKTILSGIATAVTGLDKAYNEKELLSNTIQAIQVQMRADRKTQAAAIYSKMFQDPGTNRILTPITAYTLSMALSDTERYYQAGTVPSALVGLNKTVNNAEHNADTAKDQASPNAPHVIASKATAVPITPKTIVPISRVTAPLPPAVLAPQSDLPTRFGRKERAMSQKEFDFVLGILCLPKASDLGPLGSSARQALSHFLTENGRPPSDKITPEVWAQIVRLDAAGKRNC